MRALGLNCAASHLYLALLEDDILVDDEPMRLGMVDLTSGVVQIKGFLATFKGTLLDLRPDRAGFLLPENTYKGSYGAHADRAATETLIRLAALDADVPCERITKAKVRASLRKDGTEERILGLRGRYWGQGRAEAGLAAAAVARL